MSDQSIQDRYYPDAVCFGCGPQNPLGLQIKSVARADGAVVASWMPRPEHRDGMGAVVCGGILSTLLDCHAAAAAGYALGQASGGFTGAVTKQFTVEFLQPTPMEPLEIVAHVVQVRRRSAEVEATASFGGQESVRFRGVFVVPDSGAAA
jgi:acyl-coenzyme A thioesterase PaaI-like protein